MNLIRNSYYIILLLLLTTCATSRKATEAPKGTIAPTATLDTTTAGAPASGSDTSHIQGVSQAVVKRLLSGKKVKLKNSPITITNQSATSRAGIPGATTGSMNSAVTATVERNQGSVGEGNQSAYKGKENRQQQGTGNAASDTITTSKKTAGNWWFILLGVVAFLAAGYVVITKYIGL